MINRGTFGRGTFGNHLSHFVRTVDIVDPETKDNILSLIEKYLSEELGIKFFTLYVESMVNDKPGLRTTDWFRGGQRSSFSIKNNDGSYNGQVSLAYDKSVSLWIVNPQMQQLSLSSEYVDLWSKFTEEDIPKYIKRTENPILTSIIRPIRDDFRCFGVINFESVRYLEFSDSVVEELKVISNSINILYSLNKSYENQQNNTKQEIRYLSELKNSRGALLKVSKPKIFLASSDKAEDDIMGVIKEVLDEYASKIDLLFWKDISKNGIITQQLLREITTCQYGICYFSERTNNDSTILYKDNENVLIESGMLSAISQYSDFENWIPIREKSSPKIPFDISTNRILIVPRNESNNKLNVEKFRLNLVSKLQNWGEIF